jgi:hypothetical protein
MRKPSVRRHCVANRYAGPAERIIEFTGKAGGGLISLRNTEDGATTVDVYRCDPTVDVRTELTTTARAVLAAARVYNNSLNDPHGDGTGNDAQAPDGDSYNAILDIMAPLFEALGEVAL